MRTFIAVLANKLITFICKLFRFNGAQFPGSFVYDHIDKDILDKIKHPKITIAVTGSSGKGTTCNLIKNVLKDNNYSTLLNESGNNGINGAISLILNNLTLTGKFKYDVLILECDERHLKHIFKKWKPEYLIVTNITRDQPTRNGTPEEVFNEILKAINNKVHLVINVDDPLVNRFKLYHKGKITTYGLNKIKGDIKKNELNNLDFAYCPVCHKKLIYDYYHYGHIGNYQCPNNDFKRGNLNYYGDKLDYSNSTFNILDNKVKLSNNALYMCYAYLSCYSICNLIGLKNESIINSLNNIKNTKRGKSLSIKGRKLTMLESKNENNLSYFQSLNFIINQKDKKSIIMGFDNISRRYKTTDLSWLYDVDFELLNKDKNIDKIFCIGKFRYDVATRLEYAGIDKNKIILVDDLDNIMKLVDKKSQGDIYTMVCFDMTAIIRKKALEYETN